MMTPELQPTNDANIPTLNDEVTTHTDDALVIELQERGHRQPMAMPLTYWPLVIGRAATADLVLTDASIARANIRLHRNDAGAVEVEVLDTTNGVWLNKRHYRAGERFEWSPGQRLSLGRSLQFLLRSSSQPLAATQRWQPSPRWQATCRGRSESPRQPPCWPCAACCSSWPGSAPPKPGKLPAICPPC